jgi:endonuclease/exonuclease/phosphatase (EEP) superfamily protein YafD
MKGHRFLMGMAGVLTLLSLLSFVAWGYPWELISHFRLQYGAAAIGLFLLTLVLRRSLKARFWPMVCWALFLVALNASLLLPWYFPHGQQTQAAANLRILSANVNKRNQNYEPTIALVKAVQPDVVVWIEVNRQWMEQLNRGIGEEFPYRFFEESSGLAMWSRLPWSNMGADSLGSDDLSLVATIAVGNSNVNVIGTHLMVPFRRDLFERRNKQLNGLSEAIAKRTLPTIVMGDLNLTPWSPYYGKLIRETGLHNAQLGFGIFPTYPQPSPLTKFPSWMAPLLQMPIDHGLVTREIRVRNFYREPNGDADHTAIGVDLVVGALELGKRPEPEGDRPRHWTAKS